MRSTLLGENLKTTWWSNTYPFQVIEISKIQSLKVLGGFKNQHSNYMCILKTYIFINPLTVRFLIEKKNTKINCVSKKIKLCYSLDSFSKHEKMSIPYFFFWVERWSQWHPFQKRPNLKMKNVCCLVCEKILLCEYIFQQQF